MHDGVALGSALNGAYLRQKSEVRNQKKMYKFLGIGHDLSCPIPLHFYPEFQRNFTAVRLALDKISSVKKSSGFGAVP